MLKAEFKIIIRLNDEYISNFMEAIGYDTFTEADVEKELNNMEFDIFGYFTERQIEKKINVTK